MIVVPGAHDRRRTAGVRTRSRTGLRRQGWDGVWVFAFGSHLRKTCFQPRRSRPWPTQEHPPGRPRHSAACKQQRRQAQRLLRHIRLAQHQIGLYEAKVGSDRIRDTQRKFFDTVPRFHQPDAFTIIEIPA